MNIHLSLLNIPLSLTAACFPILPWRPQTSRNPSLCNTPIISIDNSRLESRSRKKQKEPLWSSAENTGGGIIRMFAAPIHPTRRRQERCSTGQHCQEQKLPTQASGPRLAHKRLQVNNRTLTSSRWSRSELPDIPGKSQKESSRGKSVLLRFGFATNCPFCEHLHGVPPISARAATESKPAIPAGR